MENTIAKMGELNKDNSVRALIVRGVRRACSLGFDLKATFEREMRDTRDWQSQM
jgi:enoyl-CoA hydratase/carnithine racemase